MRLRSNLGGARLSQRCAAFWVPGQHPFGPRPNG